MVKASEGGRSSGLSAVDSVLTSLASRRRQCIRSYIKHYVVGTAKWQWRAQYQTRPSDKGIRSEEEKAGGTLRDV